MHNDDMRLGMRDDPDRGPTRIVIWSDSSESDLSSLVVAGCALALFVGSTVCAIELPGIPHTVAIVVAVLSGIYAALMIVPLLLILWVVNAIEGAVAERPSAMQRGAWVAGAVLVGAVLGSDTYAEGFPGLAFGLSVPVIILVARRTVGSVPARIRRAGIKLLAITAVTAIAVGLTIFL